MKAGVMKNAQVREGSSDGSGFVVGAKLHEKKGVHKES